MVTRLDWTRTDTQGRQQLARKPEATAVSPEEVKNGPPRRSFATPQTALSYRFFKEAGLAQRNLLTAKKARAAQRAST